MHQDDRDINAESLLHISRILADRAGEMRYTGDVSDLGNEVGIAIGSLLTGMTEEETWDLVAGIRHGVSLTNGTH